MHIIILGRKRHPTHPTISKFLELGRHLGHHMDFCDHLEFPKRDLKDVPMVILISHYYDPGVCSKIDTECPESIRLINSTDAISICRDRLLLYENLREAGACMPEYAKNDEELKKLDYPVIRKPRDSSLHEIKVFDEPPESPDFGKFYYEDFILTDGFDYKIYCVGDRRWLIKRESSFKISQEEKVKEKREEMPVFPELREVALMVGEMTGLEIFGVDFIKSGDRFYLIDVNPFPGFIGVPGAAEHWWDYISKKFV